MHYVQCKFVVYLHHFVITSISSSCSELQMQIDTRNLNHSTTTDKIGTFVICSCYDGQTIQLMTERMNSATEWHRNDLHRCAAVHRSGIQSDIHSRNFLLCWHSARWDICWVWLSTHLCLQYTYTPSSIRYTLRVDHRFVRGNSLTLNLNKICHTLWSDGVECPACRHTLIYNHYWIQAKIKDSSFWVVIPWHIDAQIV